MPFGCFGTILFGSPQVVCGFFLCGGVFDGRFVALVASVECLEVGDATGDAPVVDQTGGWAILLQFCVLCNLCIFCVLSFLFFSGSFVPAVRFFVAEAGFAGALAEGALCLLFLGRLCRSLC